MPEITTQELEVAKVPEEKPLSIRLLGPPEVSFEERSLRFGRKKVLALLCYLAATDHHRVESLDFQP